ncbi:MAG TPA: TonB-dependent receptor [Xanthomonadaceae bacterium]|nr:TonB-dependent receptor [Xanthomonadaceae bacterium]
MKGRAHTPLLLAMMAALGHDAMAAPEPQDHRHEPPRRLEEITITASPLDSSGEDLVQPVDVIVGPELDAAKAGTLGETVARQPGVQSSFFGAGVGRPIIRGLEGARVQVLEGGTSSLDASTVSADHAVSIEPFLADQIEILKGPAVLLYGSGAIGGAVNVVDGRVPESLPAQALTGRAELRGNTVSDERTAMARIDAGAGSLALHADAFWRDAEDYEIPGFAEIASLREAEHEDEDQAFGVLPNSAVETRGGAIGASWIGERGFIGAAVSTYRTLYGVPGHGHEEEEDHEEGHEDEEEHADEDAVRIDLDQTRVDLKAALLDPWRGFDKISVDLVRNEYEHVELEGDEVGTRFQNEGVESRIEAVHAPLGNWRGAFGLQSGRRDFSAVGEEAFVPPTETRDTGLFWIEEGDFDAWKLELGARYDDVEVDALGFDRADFGALSLSAGALWRATEAVHLSFSVDRAERAPTTEELFSSGPHLATRTFELGDPDLDTEIANQFELGLHVHRDPVTARVAVYQNRFDDFIYLVDVGEEADGLPVRQWSQADVRFRGIEAEIDWRIADNEAGAFDLRLFGDTVEAELEDGGHLPRIAPARFGAGLTWERDGWRASLGAVRYADQDDVAAGETPTDGYTLVDAHLSRHFDIDDLAWEVFLDGRNLTDREARVHTSFLKDVAPLPGRAVAFGVRVFF